MTLAHHITDLIAQDPKAARFDFNLSDQPHTNPSHFGASRWQPNASSAEDFRHQGQIAF